MATATERIPILVTAQEKTRIVRQAREAGVSTGEFLRRAAAAFSPANDPHVLDGLFAQLEQSSARAQAALDAAFAEIAASEKRIAALEKRAARKTATGA